MLRRSAAAFLAAALLTVCGDGDGESTAPTLDVTATTSAPSATTIPADRALGATPGACPAAPVPAGATEVAAAAGDFDGDRRPDEVRTYRHTGDYYVQVGLAAGGGSTLRVRPELQAALAPIGAFDVDGDGVDEIWLDVSSGGPVRVVGLVSVDGCKLSEVTLDGSPARFAISRTFIGGAGILCGTQPSGGASLSVFDGSSGDGNNFTVQRKVFTLDGSALTTVSEATSNETAATAQFGFNCGSLRF